MFKSITKPIALCAIALAFALSAPLAPAALDSFGYDYYNFYDPGYDSNSYDDDWFYDHYDYNSEYDYDANNTYDADWFDWEEDGLF